MTGVAKKFVVKQAKVSLSMASQFRNNNARFHNNLKAKILRFYQVVDS